MGKISSSQILDIFIKVRQTEFAADWMWGMKGKRKVVKKERRRKENQR